MSVTADRTAPENAMRIYLRWVDGGVPRKKSHPRRNEQENFKQPQRAQGLDARRLLSLGFRRGGRFHRQTHDECGPARFRVNFDGAGELLRHDAIHDLEAETGA